MPNLSRTAPIALGLLTLIFSAASTRLLASDPSRAAQGSSHSRFLELRIYEAHPDQRDRFLAHFEEHYVESQEAEGMRIWGQFRDLETPHQFVWMRGYRDFASRPDSLMRFYTSPLWAETSPAVGKMLARKATHVHFLEPTSPQEALDDGFDRNELPHEPGVIVVHLFSLGDDSPKRIEWMREKLIPALDEAGARTLGLFRSSDKPNNFPPLPFIEDEPSVVWIGSYPDREAYERVRNAFPDGARPYESFLLEPGPRSRLHHR